MDHDTTKWTVLVTAATGRVGGQVAAQLTQPDIRVRALVREPTKASAKLPASVEIVGGNLTEPTTLSVRGPERLTQREQLSTLGEALGRPLRFEEITAEEAGAELFPGMVGGRVASIIEGQHAMETQPEPVTDTVAR